MKKLQIGAGDKALYDWDNLDIRPGKGINLVQDCTDLKNIKSNTYDHIIAEDVIEHISWRLTRKALKEWRRVLKTGGTIEIETPSAEELRRIVSKDLGLRKLDIDATSFDYFSRVAFGHQDHEGNYHKAYFTKEWLIMLMSQAGFKDISTIFGDDFRFRLRATK